MRPVGSAAQKSSSSSDTGMDTARCGTHMLGVLGLLQHFFDLGGPLKSKLLRFLLIVAVTSTTACTTPPPPTTKEACTAWLDMDRNTPHDDNIEGAKFTRQFYETWSGKIDGALGTAFAQHAAYDTKFLNKAGETDEAIGLLMHSLETIYRICGAPVS